MIKKILMVLLPLALIGVVVFAATKLINKKPASSLVDSKNYQAVFLTNGQVYFGKLKNYDTENPILEDVYYLMEGGPLQEVGGGEAVSDVEEGAESVEPSSQQLVQSPGFTLVKLGDEVHAPKDKMILNRAHILFVEDLKGDGRLMKALLESKEQTGAQQ
jgi:small nuclear ribonucleoprotein (snRNP)-like protein